MDTSPEKRTDEIRMLAQATAMAVVATQSELCGARMETVRQKMGQLERASEGHTEKLEMLIEAVNELKIEFRTEISALRQREKIWPTLATIVSVLATVALLIDKFF